MRGLDDVDAIRNKNLVANTSNSYIELNGNKSNEINTRL